MTVKERFLSYICYPSGSSEESGSVPSTPGQRLFADALVRELQALGLSDAVQDENGVVYAHLPPSCGCETAPCLGFLAHMDTSPEFSGEGVCAREIPDYDGGKVALAGGRVLDPADYPHLSDLRGKTLLCPAGETLLGADDKAGIAEILTALEEILATGLPHGAIAVAFTPDEEIGRGVDHFDLARFGADFAFTVDGGAAGEIESENFNAATARLSFRGVSVHPGSACGRMVNAIRMAMEFASLLPDERPENTSGRQGFYHITDMNGGVGEASVHCILRDFTEEGLEKRKNVVTEAARLLSARYPAGSVSLSIRDSYRNMKPALAGHRHLLDEAEKATRAAGLTPATPPIRGGTDGALLSLRGLPCPNLGTGGYAFHGPYEHIAVEDMEAVTRVLTALVSLYASVCKENLT